MSTLSTLPAVVSVDRSGSIQDTDVEHILNFTDVGDPLACR